MTQNNIEPALKMQMIESGTTQKELVNKPGVSIANVNRITKAGSRSSIRPLSNGERTWV